MDVRALKRGLFHAQIYDQISKELLVAGSCFLMRSLYGVQIRVTRVTCGTCCQGGACSTPLLHAPPLHVYCLDITLYSSLDSWLALNFAGLSCLAAVRQGSASMRNKHSSSSSPCATYSADFLCFDDYTSTGTKLMPTLTHVDENVMRSAVDRGTGVRHARIRLPFQQYSISKMPKIKITWASHKFPVISNASPRCAPSVVSTMPTSCG